MKGLKFPLMRTLKKGFAILILLALMLACYIWGFRPGQLRWGASSEEIALPMPGDEIVLHPTFKATRAVTIAATSEEIYPWLVQMGYGRAGFYGYDLLENLGSSLGIRSADRIIPEFQNLKAGDKVYMWPTIYQTIHSLAPDQFLVWADVPNSSFAWSLYPVDPNHTRLVSRIRFRHRWFDRLFTEYTDHLAMRKILLGIKDRAEGNVEPFAIGAIEFGVYCTALLAFITALLLVAIRPLTARTWLTGLATGIIFLVAWYGPAPPWIGAPFLLAVPLAWRWTFWKTRGHKQ